MTEQDDDYLQAAEQNIRREFDKTISGLHKLGQDVHEVAQACDHEYSTTSNKQQVRKQTELFVKDVMRRAFADVTEAAGQLQHRIGTFHTTLRHFEHDAAAFAKLSQYMRWQESDQALGALLTPRPYNRLSKHYAGRLPGVMV